MVFVTVFIIIISRANVGNWTALRVDLSSHIHHVFFSRPSDVVKTVFVIVFTSFGASETLHVVTCGFSTYFIIFSSCVLMSALSCVICYSSSFLHRKFVLASFLLVLRYSSSSFHRAFEMYEFLRVFDVIWL